ncbi:unnamed protein product [Parnassius apollo]|uniref:(apollo) hypothetical protein n=1 Tax=Parnassius apollo TaxID=110799 RepID=A0A8S3XJ16_PARAO|nr:unnamed protein product [Parnassius apollo]
MLWDSKDPDHLNKSKREDCWRKISKEMKLPIPELKKKLDSLTEQSSTTRTITTTDAIATTTRAPQEPTPSPQEPTPSPQELTPSPQEPTPSLQEPSPSPQPSRKKIRLNTNAQNDSLDNILKDIFAIIEKSSTSINDPCVAFDNHIAHELRKYDSYTQSCVKNAINTIIHEADI